MQGLVVPRHFLTFAFFATTILFLSLTIIPQKALADVAMVKTEQAIPPGGTSCPALSVTSVQPYIYNGALDSFDVVIPDSSYVSILGEVGNTAVPFFFMRRATTGNGELRIQVEIPTSPINGSLPVSLTLLSAQAGQPVCASIVSFDVTSNGTILPAAPIPQTKNNNASNSPSPTATNTTGGWTSSSAQKPASSASSGKSAPASATSLATTASSTVNVTGSVLGNTFTNSLTNLCTGNGAYRLWLVLLVIYLLIVGGVIFSQPAVVNRSTQGAVAAILVPLVLLIAFWYFAPECRGASLIPLVACFIGIGGLFIAFGEQKEDTTVIALPEKL